MGQFHDVLKMARRKKGWLAKDVAAKIQKSPSYYSELENGYRPIPKDNELIELLQHVLDIPDNQLVGLAAIDREISSNDIIAKVLKSDSDLALDYCRATENASDKEIREALEKFIKQLERGNK